LASQHLTQPNPAVQVALSYAGYFNGFTWSNTWKLPFEAQRILAVWERQSNVGESFSRCVMLPSAFLDVCKVREWGNGRCAKDYVDAWMLDADRSTYPVPH